MRIAAVIAAAAVGATALPSGSAALREPYMGVGALHRPTLHDSRRATLNITQAFAPAPSADDGRAQDDGEGPRPPQLHLSYDVSHPTDAKVVKLAQLGDSLVSVRCTADALHLAFATPAAAGAFHGELAAIASAATATAEDRVIVTGGPEWRCAKRAADHAEMDPRRRNPYTSPHGIILRKSSAAALAESLAIGTAAAATAGGDDSGTDAAAATTVVSFATEQAGYHDVFETASVRFRTSAFPENSFHQHDHPETAPSGAEDSGARDSPAQPGDGGDEDDVLRGSVSRRQLSWGSFWSAATSVVSALTTAGSKIVEVVETVGEVITDVVDLVVTGDLSLDKSLELSSFGWNYNSATQGAKEASTTIGSGVVCKGCYAHAELDLVFDLDIASYKVSYFKISALGAFKSNVEFDMSASYTASWDFNKTVATITLDPIILDIFGVPVSIDISAPIVLGASATLTANAHASAAASASGSVEYGIQYDGSTLHTVSDKSFTYDGGLTSLSADVTVVATAYVMPVISVIVECIGGPKVSLKPHVDLQAAAAVDESIISLLSGVLDNIIAVASGAAAPGSGGSTGSGTGTGTGTGGSPKTTTTKYVPSKTTTTTTALADSYYYSNLCSWWACSDYTGSQTGGGYGQTNCDVFCSASQPCTPSCSDWGCSNCRRQLSSSSSSCPNGVSLALSWGFEVTLGATIDVSIAGLSIGYKKDFPQTTVMSISNPIASGCVDAASLLGTGRGRRLSTSAIVPSTGIEPGDLFAGQIEYTGSGSKCGATYGGQSTYMDMNVRVASVLATGSGDIIDVVSTLNYAGGQSANSGGPFACIAQSMYTWSTYFDGSGTMTRASDQSGVEITQCTDGNVPQIGYYCTGFGSSGISCSDTLSCFTINLVKTAGPGTGSSMTTLTPEGVTTASPNKCYGLGERVCLATDGCGWCIDDSYNSGCMAAPYKSNLPWTTEYGDVLENCNKGWQT